MSQTSLMELISESQVPQNECGTAQLAQEGEWVQQFGIPWAAGSGGGVGVGV